MIKRYGEAVRAGVSYKKRPGVYAILPRGNDVLLTFQQEPNPEFQLPGGGIDPGEHPITALHREVLEETGWRIAQPRRLGAFRRFVYMPEYDLWAEKICAVYLAMPVRRLCDPTEAGHSDHWVPRQLAMQIVENYGDQAFIKSLRD
ncbi:MAG: NUDIX domain-containing protein [Paracoccaceae bacterium]